MKNNFLPLSFLLAVLFLLNSCSPKLESSWKKPNYKGKEYSKVVVVGIGKDLTARLSFENDAVDLLTQNGVNAIPGNSIFPPGLSPKKGDTAAIVRILKENNIDAVITMSLIKKEQSQGYVQGQTYPTTLGYAPFGRYYYGTYAYVTEPGYYEDRDSYLIEAVFYDVMSTPKKGENNVVWSGQSSLVNPSSAQDAASRFTQKMVGSLINDQIIITE